MSQVPARSDASMLPHSRGSTCFFLEWATRSLTFSLWSPILVTFSLLSAYVELGVCYFLAFVVAQPSLAGL